MQVKVTPATPLPWQGITHTKDGWTIGAPWQQGRYTGDKNGQFMPYECDVYNSQYLNGGSTREGAVHFKITGERSGESCWNKAQAVIEAHRRANAYPRLVEALRECISAASDQGIAHAGQKGRALLHELGESE